MDINSLSDVLLANMFFHSVGCLFILLMVSFAVQKLFSLMWSHLFIFFFVFCAQGDRAEKIWLREMYGILLPIFSFRIYMVSSLLFKSLINFEFIFIYGVIRCPSFIFFIYLSNFLNTIYWIDCCCPIACFCLLCQILIDCIGVGLFLGSLFSSIALCICFYASTMLFWLLWPCSIVWY